MLSIVRRQRLAIVSRVGRKGASASRPVAVRTFTSTEKDPSQEEEEYSIDDSDTPPGWPPNKWEAELKQHAASGEENSTTSSTSTSSWPPPGWPANPFTSESSTSATPVWGATPAFVRTSLPIQLLIPHHFHPSPGMICRIFWNRLRIYYLVMQLEKLTKIDDAWTYGSLSGTDFLHSFHRANGIGCDDPLPLDQRDKSFSKTTVSHVRQGRRSCCHSSEMKDKNANTVPQHSRGRAEGIS
jgi:hypothetical protein